MWPKIRRNLPDAEFHIYYGADLLQNTLKLELEPLFNQAGVFEHGRTSYDDTIKARYKAYAQLYVSGTPLEIDCLSIREAAVTGCIPILSEVGVFAERTGIHISGDPMSQDTLERAANTVLDLVKLPDDKVETLIKSLKESAMAQTWIQTGQEWLRIINAPVSR